MKKFLIYFVIFTIPIILSIVCCEFFLRKIPNDYSYKKQYLDKNTDSIVTLFLGSSHAFYGINPQFCKEKSFNASHISQSLDFDYKILNKYENNFTNLKNIVIPISYFSLFGKLEKGIEYWRVKNYSIYYKIYTTNKLSDYSEFLSNKFKYTIHNLYAYFFKSKTLVSCSELGFGLNFNSKNSRDLIETGKTAAVRHQKKDLSLFDENFEILLKIIKYAENRHIKVYFFTPPAYESYVNNLDTIQLNKMLTTMNDLDKKCSNCTYYNFMNDTSFIAIDFFDADHLNEIGAEKLTKKIDSLINIKN